MNIIQIQIANDLNSKSQNNSLKMFLNFGLIYSSYQNSQALQKDILEHRMRFLGIFALLLIKFLRLSKFLNSSFKNIDMMHT